MTWSLLKGSLKLCKGHGQGAKSGPQPVDPEVPNKPGQFSPSSCQAKAQAQDFSYPAILHMHPCPPAGSFAPRIHEVHPETGRHEAATGLMFRREPHEPVCDNSPRGFSSRDRGNSFRNTLCIWSIGSGFFSALHRTLANIQFIRDKRDRKSSRPDDFHTRQRTSLKNAPVLRSARQRLSSGCRAWQSYICTWPVKDSIPRPAKYP